MNAYNKNIERRKDRLRDLLAIEDRNYVRETIDVAQKRKIDNFLQANVKLAQIRAKKEEERLKLLEEKRLQQYIERCTELIPLVMKRRQKEATQGQLLQIAEKESVKESERELNHVWCDMFMKEKEAGDERERIEKVAMQNKMREDRYFWDSQIQAHDATKLDEVRRKQEEAIEMKNLKEKQEQEDLKTLDVKRRARDKNMRAIMDQIRVKQEELRRQEQKDKSFNAMQLDLAKKANIFEDKRMEAQERLKNEMQQYAEYYANLEEERKREQVIVDQLVNMEVKEIQRKQDETRCQLQRAKETLNANVAKGRAEQLEHKRQKAEQESQLKQAENRLAEVARQQNERLRAEQERQRYLMGKKYGEDLKSQIDHLNKLKQEEQDIIERQIKMGIDQESEYKRKLMALAKVENLEPMVHPFRQVINREKCPCPKTIYFS